MTRWQALVSGASKPGLYRLPPRTNADAVCRAVEGAGWRVLTLDGSEIGDKDSFLRVAARALKFPSYFGKNWDAFEECLNDLEWAPAEGYVILFSHAARFAKSPDWPIARAILADAVRNWGEQGKSMYILVGGIGESLPALE